MGNANILKMVFVPYCKMVFQGGKKQNLKCSFSIKSSGLILMLTFYFYILVYDKIHHWELKMNNSILIFSR